MKRLLTLISILILSTASSAEQYFEVGFGTNYGGILGGTINVDLNSNTEVFVGLGAGFDGVNYVVGTKFWLNEKLRLSANHGYNCTVETVSTTTTYKDYNGLNFGIGYAFWDRKSGPAIDLMLLDTSDCNEAAGSSESSSQLKIALGYRF